MAIVSKCSLLMICLSVLVAGCAAPKQTTSLAAPRFSAVSPTQGFHANWIGLYKGEADIRLETDQLEDGDFRLNIEYVHPHVIVTGWAQHDAEDSYSSARTEGNSFSFAAPSDDPLEISGDFHGFDAQGKYERVVCTLRRAGNLISGTVRAYITGDRVTPLPPDADFTFNVVLEDAEPKRLFSR